MLKVPPAINNFWESRTFFCSAWIIIFLLFCWLVVLLNKFFSKRVFRAFARIVSLDKEQKKQISRLVLGGSVLLPFTQIIGVLWVGVLRRHGCLPVLGVKFGYGIGPLYTAAVFGFIFCCAKLIYLYHKAYRKNDSFNKRPIHAFVSIFYGVLFFMGLFIIMSQITKERPLVLISSFGAAFAIFVFAFKNHLASVTANVQLNIERIVKVGDWISLPAYNVDGIVEAINARTIQVRNWDMSLASFPIKNIMDDTLFNYSAMQASGARQIKRELIVDQKSIRFLTKEEINALKESHLIADETLKRAESSDDTSKLAPCRLWTNLELFCLYAEDYLGRRETVRHDMDCVLRLLAATGFGVPLEIYCYDTNTALVPFEKSQRLVFCHLLAVLPLFHLRVSQVSAFRTDEDHNNSAVQHKVCSD